MDYHCAAPGRMFRHYKGDLYIVLLLARREHDNRPVVIYERLARTGDPRVDGPWERELAGFEEQVHDKRGALVRRFARWEHGGDERQALLR